MQSFDEHVVGVLIAADVAGYSGLIGVEGTHERLKAHLGPYPTDKNGRLAGQPVGRERQEQ
jgi:hypothetical protein